MNEDKPLNQLPEMPSKDEICKLYSDQKRSYILKQINIILVANKLKTTTRIIRKPIFKEVLEVIGVPEGYEPFHN